jgi:L-iditol 2-dehydrogenase
MTHAILLQAMKADVLVSDIIEGRLEFARTIGVNEALNAEKVDVPAEAKRLTGGLGPDFAIVAAGSPKAIVQAIKSVRRGGKVCLFGVPPRGSYLEYDVSEVFNSEVSIVSSYAATDIETKKALGLIAGRKVNFRPLITHRFHLDEFDLALETAAKGEGMKTVILP